MSLFGKKDDAKIAEYDSAVEALREFEDSDSFKEPSTVINLLQTYSGLHDRAVKQYDGLLSKLGLGSRDVKEHAGRFCDTYNVFEEVCDCRNRQLAMKAYRSECICPVEGRSLDDDQLEAIYTDVDTRLILSGAGSGKTTTVVGLAKHLFASGTEPEKVQFISFTNNSVSELRVRIRKETGKEADVKTFHRLGMRIITECNGKKPKISHIDLPDFVLRYLESKKDDRRFQSLLARYTMMYQCREEDQIDRDRERFEKKYTHTAADGTKVKSQGEVDIANHLYFMGIPYIYEDSYIADTSDSEHSQYHPDFHIKDTPVYIEFFGINRQGEVSDSITGSNPDASADYRSGIAWKRETHRKYGTVMIETFSYQRSEGNLMEILDAELEKNGIRPGEIDAKAALSEAFGSTERAYRNLANEFSLSISLLEGTGREWEEAFPEGRDYHQRATLSVLERILRPIYDEYRDALSTMDEIDFQDMLVMSEKIVRSGRFVPDFEYMVVDEYQDITPAAYRLLRAIRDRCHYRLFCVGDDWQSIYRFNGSEVGYIMDFERYWGPSKIFSIGRTYRYSGQLLDMSGRFIMENPRQIKKDIIGPADRNTSVVPLLSMDRTEMAQDILDTVMMIPEGEDVLFIGRYHYDIMFLEDRGFEWKKDTFSDSLMVRCLPRPDLKIIFRTAHASKGLQADNVIILNNRRGRSGFPSTAPESPLVSLLLDGGSKDEDERRLYYVAMTRARKRLFLAVPMDVRERSEFVSELYPAKRCPECGGTLVLKKGRYGCFYGCTNYRKDGCKHIENL